MIEIIRLGNHIMEGLCAYNIIYMHVPKEPLNLGSYVPTLNLIMAYLVFTCYFLCFVLFVASVTCIQ